MEPREIKGLEIAAKTKLTRKGTESLASALTDQ